MSSTREFRSRVSERAPPFKFPFACLGALLIVSDLLAILLSNVVAELSWGGLRNAGNGDILYYAIVTMLLLNLSQGLGLYRLRNLLHPERAIRPVLWAALLSALALGLILLAENSGNVIYMGVVSFLVCLLLTTVMFRLGFSALVCAGIQRGFIQGRKAILIGAIGEFEQLKRTDIVGFGLDELARIHLTGTEETLSTADLARLNTALEFARKSRTAEFALLLPWGRKRLHDEVVRRLSASPLAVRLYPDRNTREILGRTPNGEVDCYSSVMIRREPISPSDRLLKRLLDVSLSLMALIAFGPLLALVAILIKCDSPGPILFRQQRRGFDGKEFSICKFRSMTVLENGPVIVQARRNDDRVTAVGRVLRKTSIDEIPQLINVLKGEMSLVGPRPHAVAHDELYGTLIPDYLLRQHVKPGLTGYAQVAGLRGETSDVTDMEKRIQCDVWYVKNWSFGLDVRLIFQTFGALLRHQAY